MKDIIHLIIQAVDWNTLLGGLIAAIIALIKKGKDINKLNKAFGKEAVSKALSEIEKGRPA